MSPQGQDAGEVFTPPLLLRHRHLQTILASFGPRAALIRRRRGGLPSTPWVLDCGAGVRLQAFGSPSANGPSARGVAVLLHGWEGSAESAYLLSAAMHLSGRGYEVVRLNFRDHGETHALNRELFHSCRLGEVVGAVRAIAERHSGRPIYLVGFSLGGNFALRVGLRLGPRSGVALERIVAISPVIRPRAVLEALESGLQLYQRHFIVKWQRSLRRKQAAFPELYDFEEWFRVQGLREQTRYLVERYSEFASLEAYLDGYSIEGARLADLAVPATLVHAQDDPIIPIEDVLRLERPDCLELEIHPRGGHCGFIRNLRLESWIDVRIGRALGGGDSRGK